MKKNARISFFFLFSCVQRKDETSQHQQQQKIDELITKKIFENIYRRKY